MTTSRHSLGHLLVNKTSVDFIMNPEMPPSPHAAAAASWHVASVVQDLIEKEFQHTCLTKPMPAQRNKCSIDGCPTAAVSKGLCVRHGGGTRCSVVGCTKRTKRFNRCYLHGGYVLCSQMGCTSKAKRYGRCWAHGGGVQCHMDGCSKLAAKGGLCWSHGGGHRCRAADCDRRAYKRQNFFCDEHVQPVQDHSEHSGF
ncbi:Aste57867_10765 [Aphanomyces stellatus]|uniref:Aste57867_10765 protein n=1 Tax=Aphanomyces stellatus TaxID=120398 RepID=A0A485KRC3_9STRA|nr:hypothetical protein As57867_010725 [Aphanomyces stellatus]VFT87635.1 Aste57867_10765 [Aphanomyces stellatus]